MKYETTKWELYPGRNRQFELYFHFMGWHVIQFGISVDFIMMNIQIFFPFGFIHFGKSSQFDLAKSRKELK